MFVLWPLEVVNIFIATRTVVILLVLGGNHLKVEKGFELLKLWVRLILTFVLDFGDRLG